MKLILTIVTAVFLIHANIIAAAGFDCAKAANTVENLICNNENLSQLDDKNTALFRDYKSTSKDEGQALQDQRDWLKHTRNACLDASCLESTYQNRNAYLASRVESNRATVEGSGEIPASTTAAPVVTSQEDLPAATESVSSNTETQQLPASVIAPEETDIQPQQLETVQSADIATPETGNPVAPENAKDTKLNTFTALHAQEFSGGIVFLLLIAGFIFPMIMRKVF
jgi:uncharacterized protein